MPDTAASTSLVPAPARLGLGLAALGRPGYINLGHGSDLEGRRDVDALRARAYAVLDAARAAGVRDFDAARSYGLAENFLADWLNTRQLGSAAVSVGSKWGYTYTADWQVQANRHEVKEHSLANFARQWPQSRALLGDWLTVYLAHSVTPDSPLPTDGALLERLAQLRPLGVLPGLSLSGPAQSEVLLRALDLQVGGQPVFGAVQATWNLLEPSVGPALHLAARAGWKIYLKEAVANGRLTVRGEPLPPVLERICRVRGASPDAVALAAALAQPFAGVVLSGASTVAQLESNLTARHVGLSDSELGELATLAEEPKTYWQIRSALSWN